MIRSAFALTYRLHCSGLANCRAFYQVPLPPVLVRTVTNSWDPSLLGHYSRFPATTIPAATHSASTNFPGSPVIWLSCSSDFALGRGGLLQFLGMSLSSCCRVNPANVNRRISQFASIHAVFAIRQRARPLGFRLFEAKYAFNVLRPDDSQPPLGWLCR
jgi:hypothetical protein